MPQFLPSIWETETVTCLRCNTRQYPRNGRCIRCQFSLRVGYLTIEIDTPADPQAEDYAAGIARWIGILLRNLRNRHGICQEQMAKLAAGIDRSYLSKAENGLALLPLNKLLPLGRALGLTAVILRFEEPRLRTFPKPTCRP